MESEARNTLRTSRSVLAIGLVVLFVASSCGANAALSPEQTAALAVAERNVSQLNLTADLSTSQLLDSRTGEITGLRDVVTGDRAVLMWYWAPT